MGYRVVYGETKPQKQRNIRGTVGFQTLTAAFLLLFVLGVRFYWPEGTAVLRQWLLPGEPSVTETAVQTFAELLAQGEPVGEAVTAFCREIVENANLPE